MKVFPKQRFIFPLLLMLSFALVALAFSQHAAPASAAPSAGYAKVFFVHAAPFTSGAAEVTINAGGNDVATLAYGQTSDRYVAVWPGNVTFTATATGMAEPLVTQPILLQSGLEYTVVLVGGSFGWPVQFLTMPDNNTPPVAGKARLRLLHTAPFAPTDPETHIDVRVQRGQISVPVIVDRQYLYSAEAEFPADTYDLLITRAGDPNAVLLDPPPITIIDQQILTGLFMGDGGVNQPFSIMTFNMPDRPSGPPPGSNMLYLPAAVLVLPEPSTTN